MQSSCTLCVKCLWCLQSKINSPEKHKEIMLGYLSGWNAPHIKHLIAETPSESILLSHIYERQACCSTGLCAAVVWQRTMGGGCTKYHMLCVHVGDLQEGSCHGGVADGRRVTCAGR